MRCRPRIPSGAPILSDAWGCSERWGPKRHRPRSSRSKGPICQAAAGAPATVTDRAGTPARGDKKPRPGHQRGGLRRECPAGAPSAHLRTRRGLTDQGGSALPVHPATAGRTSGGCHSGRTARVLGSPGSLWSPGVQPRLAHSPCPLTVLGSASERPPATPGGASSQAGSSLTATFSRRRTHLHQPKQQPHPQALTIKLVSAHASYERLHFQEALPEQPHVKGATATNAGRARSVSGRAPLLRPKLHFLFLSLSLAHLLAEPVGQKGFRADSSRAAGLGLLVCLTGATTAPAPGGRQVEVAARGPAPGAHSRLSVKDAATAPETQTTEDARRPTLKAQTTGFRGGLGPPALPPAWPPAPPPTPPPGTRHPHRRPLRCPHRRRERAGPAVAAPAGSPTSRWLLPVQPTRRPAGMQGAAVLCPSARPGPRSRMHREVADRQDSRQPSQHTEPCGWGQVPNPSPESEGSKPRRAVGGNRSPHQS